MKEFHPNVMTESFKDENFERIIANRDSSQTLEIFRSLDFGPHRAFIEGYLERFEKLIEDYEYKGLEENSHIFEPVNTPVGSNAQLIIDKPENPCINLRTLTIRSFGTSFYTTILLGRSSRPFLRIHQSILPSPGTTKFDEIDLVRPLHAQEIIVTNTEDVIYSGYEEDKKLIPLESALRKLKGKMN